MTLHVDIPDSLVRQANELAERQHVSVDQVVAAALSGLQVRRKLYHLDLVGVLKTRE